MRTTVPMPMYMAEGYPPRRSVTPSSTPARTGREEHLGGEARATIGRGMAPWSSAPEAGTGVTPQP
jgi:hypothetical protein